MRTAVVPQSCLENRLEQAPVLGGCQSGAPLEQSAKEGWIFVTDLHADFIHGGVTAFQQSFSRFDTQVLHVVNERTPGGGLEAPFQRTLGNVCMVDNPLNGTTVAKMLAQPVLARLTTE